MKVLIVERTHHDAGVLRIEMNLQEAADLSYSLGKMCTEYVEYDVNLQPFMDLMRELNALDLPCPTRVDRS